MKRITFILILIFSISFFSACSNKEFIMPLDGIFSGVSFYNNGQIVQSIGIGVNSCKISALAKQGECVQFKSNLIKGVELLRQKFLLNFAARYLKNPNEKYKIGDGVKLSQTVYNQKVDVIYFNMIFSSINAWKYYHQQGHDEEKQGYSFPLFIKKVSSQSTFPFSVIGTDGENIAMSYKQIYLSASDGLSFEEEIRNKYSPTFVYHYATQSNKIKSDSHFKLSYQNLNYHIWVAEEDDLEGAKTNIYYYVINKGNWLLLALLLPSICLASYLIFKFVKRKSGGIS